ncbi:MAG TPA: 6-phosphogluconolactonase [Myxococcales bacterium]|nr:6-phosphogluconolactonase [Myxococcales bacterium]
MNVSVHCDADALSGAAAEEFVELARASIRSRGRFTVVLSGGGTPKRTYEFLAAPEFRNRVDWSRVEVFWGDERGVPPDHPDSNFHTASAALLEHVPVVRERFPRIRAEIPDRAAAARDYQAEIARAFAVDEAGLPPAFDLVLLGMGNDGHTASLFPEAEALREGRRWAVYVEAPQRPPPSRITLTAPILNRAREIRVLVAGEEKSATLRAVLQGPHEPRRMPIQLIQPENGRMIWLIDRAAASKLGESAVA